MLRHL
ncbi:Octopamine receptor beta-2R, partial [Araneus ventricosus]